MPESLAGRGFARCVLGSELQQDFGLHGVGVLELVDEDPLEPAPQKRPDIRVVAQKVPRTGQQVREVERSDVALERQVPVRGAAQLALQLAARSASASRLNCMSSATSASRASSNAVRVTVALYL